MQFCKAKLRVYCHGPWKTWCSVARDVTFLVESGEDRRPRMQQCGAPLAPLRPHTPRRPVPLADVTLPCPPALVCAAPRFDRLGITHAPASL